MLIQIKISLLIKEKKILKYQINLINRKRYNTIAVTAIIVFIMIMLRLKHIININKAIVRVNLQIKMINHHKLNKLNLTV